MRFSLRFNNDLPVELYPRLARAAEKAGFDQFWVSDDLFLRSVWIILASVALVNTKSKSSDTRIEKVPALVRAGVNSEY